MLVSTKIMYVSLAFCLLSGSIYTLEADKNKSEAIPLIRINVAPQDAEDEDAEEDDAINPKAHPTITRSEAFCMMANDLIIEFRDYSSLSLDQQEVLVTKWQDLVHYCSTELGLSRAGFATQIEIPEETGQQLDTIFEIYRERKKSSCVIE